MKIISNRLTGAEFARNVLVAKPERGTTLADMVKPEYWAHVLPQLQSGTRIEVMPEDGTWFAELYIRAVVEQAAIVHVLRSVVFDEPLSAGEAVGYYAKFCGPIAKWRVMRRADNHVLVEGLETKGQAEQWIADNSVLA